MIQGKTKSGFAFSVDEGVLNDMELFDALAEIDRGNYVAIPVACGRILGEQKSALYEHLRGENGRVPVDAVTQEVLEIIRALQNGKKS